MKKTLLVLGASCDQIFMVKTAQKMGLRVLTVDINPASEGFQLADDYAAISTRDLPSLYRFLDDYQRNGRKIAGVTTMGSEIPHIVAALARYLNTPGISPQSARLATNKYDMKIRLRENGIPIPWFKEITSIDDLKDTISKRGYPLVIKPIDRSGSRGVFLLDKKCDVEDLFNKAKSFSYSGRVMAEEFIPGPQVSTETIMYHGKGITPGFADRNYSSKQFLPQIIENGGWMPSALSQAQRKQVEDLVVSASLALGITDGVTKGDIVMTGEGPKIIEIAARLSGGDFCESLVPLSIGVNYVEAAIKIAIGETPDIDALEPKFQRFVVNRYFFPRPGRLVRIEGVENVLKQNWVKKLEFAYKVGDMVPLVKSHADRVGVFVAVGDSRQQVESRADWVYRTINIVTEAEVVSSRPHPCPVKYA
jgi:biotin carboxylase